MERILIVRLGAMGDVIHALPAASALRRDFPNARLDWVVESRWSDLISPGLANVLPTDTKSWRKHWARATSWRSILELRRRLAELHYDTAIDLQGTLKSSVIAGWTRAPRVIGFADPKESPARWSYHRKVVRSQGHVIEQNLELVSALSGEWLPLLRTADPALLPRDPEADEWAVRYAPSPFVVLTPAAGWRAKEWPPQRYGELAQRLLDKGLQSFINIGPGERESRLADSVEKASGGTARRLQCSITKLIALTRRAALFIGGDTGPMHLANALGVPVVAIFGPTDPARNGPYYNPHLVLRNSVSKTSYSHVDRDDPGLMKITVQQVMDAALQLLGSPRTPSTHD
jgi:heptosyltransferase-1